MPKWVPLCVKESLYSDNLPVSSIYRFSARKTSLSTLSGFS